MGFRKSACCFAIVFSAYTCFAQMYTVIDLGAGSSPTDINFGGQVVGNLNGHGFLWTNGNGFQDLGILPGGTFSTAASINDLGAVTGTADGIGTLFSPFGDQICSDLTQPFVWTQNTGMQGLGTAYRLFDISPSCDTPVPFYGSSINALGQVVGYTEVEKTYQYAFVWTSAEGFTEPGFDNWPPTSAIAISNTGQIVGQDSSGFIGYGWARSITNGVVTDLEMLSGGGGFLYGGSAANGVNDLGQVVGWSSLNPVSPDSSFPVHAVLWTPSGQILDLGTLAPDTTSAASKINSFGAVLGSSGNMNYSGVTFSGAPFEMIGRPFIWSESSGMMDLNTLISPNLGWTLDSAMGINSSGQIVGQGTLDGQPHGFLLNPIYQALVQQPINGDGSSVFSAKRGVVPVKFTLTHYGVPICPSLPATIAVTRTAGGTVGSIDESTYLANADSGSNFRVDSTACQYVYNLAASSLGVGTYRLDISINGIMVGHAVFALS